MKTQMKKSNLTPEIVALLTKEATNYVKPFIYLIEPDETHREELVKTFIACFDPADRNSEVYETYNVCRRFLGWKLDRRNFLNEYWVDKEHTIVKVWAKNKASVRKYLRNCEGYSNRKIVLAKKFDKVAFINSLTS